MAIEPRRWHKGNEELAAACIGPSIGHGKNAFPVMFESWSKFIVDLVAWAAHACTGWISALDHEIINDPVENNTVIEPFSARSMKFWAVLGALSSKVQL